MQKPAIIARFAEFFQADDGVLSSHRLTTIGAFCISSLIMLYLTQKGGMTLDYFREYLYTFAVVGVASKAIESRTFGNKETAAPATPPPAA